MYSAEKEPPQYVAGKLPSLFYTTIESINVHIANNNIEQVLIGTHSGSVRPFDFIKLVHKFYTTGLYLDSNRKNRKG